MGLQRLGDADVDQVGALVDRHRLVAFVLHPAHRRDLLVRHAALLPPIVLPRLTGLGGAGRGRGLRLAGDAITGGIGGDAAPEREAEQRRQQQAHEKGP
jgi:hypothetical protein